MKHFYMSLRMTSMVLLFFLSQSNLSAQSCNVIADTNNAQNDGFLNFSSFGQTFSPGCNGELTSVFVSMASGTPTQMEVFQMNGNTMITPALATVSGQSAQTGWLFNIQNTLSLTNGTTYYVRFTNSSPVLINYRIDNPIATGGFIPNDSFTAITPNVDLVMQISITEEVLPSCNVSLNNPNFQYDFAVQYGQDFTVACNAALTTIKTKTISLDGGTLTLTLKSNTSVIGFDIATVQSTLVGDEHVFTFNPPVFLNQGTIVHFDIEATNGGDLEIRTFQNTTSSPVYINSFVSINFSSQFDAIFDENAANPSLPFICNAMQNSVQAGPSGLEFGQSFQLSCGGDLDKIVVATSIPSDLQIEVFLGETIVGTPVAFSNTGSVVGLNLYQFDFSSNFYLQPNTTYTFLVKHVNNQMVFFGIELNDSYPNGKLFMAEEFIDAFDLRFFVSLREACLTAAPTVNAVFNFVSGQTLASINVQGSNLTWYDAAVGGNELPTSTALVDGVTYYVSATANGCESNRVAVLANLLIGTISPLNCNTTINNTQWDRIYAQEIAGATQWVFKIDNGVQSFEVNRNVDFVHFFDFMPNVSYGTTYQVSVSVFANGVHTGFGPSCPISITGAPKTSLSPAFCNVTLPSIHTNMSFRAVDFALGYKIFVKNMTTNITQTQIKTGNTSESRRVRISDFSNAALGTTFKVWAEVTLDGTSFIPVAETDPEVCEVTTPTPAIPTTQMARCNTTLPGNGVNLTAVWVSDLVQEWNYVIVDANNNTISQVTKSTNGVLLSEFSGLTITPGTPYLIKVRVKMFNVWGGFGNTCTINTAGIGPNTPIPTTQLQASRCNTVLPGVNVILRGAWVSDQVTSHTFALVDENNNIISEFESASNVLLLSNFTGINIQAGTTYRIRVKVKVNNVWGNYGGVCTVTTPGGTSTVSRANTLVDNSFKTYPNPFNEQTTVSWTKMEATQAHISVYDVTGKLIQTLTTNESSVQLGQDYTAGVYFVTIVDGEQQLQTKIVKK